MAGKRAPAPPEALEAFERTLTEGELLPRCTVVRGEEAYFARRAQSALTERAKSLDYEVIVRDGEDPDARLDDVLGEMATPPMFAPRQLFVLRGWNEKLRTQGKKVPPLVSALLAFVERPEPERAVCVVASSMRADHRVAKAAQLSLAVRKLYDSPPPWKPDPMASELVQWVRRRAKELGVDLAPRDALYVAAATGNDLGAIDAQLERVKSGEGSLTESVSWQATATPWDVADHLVGGDPASALASVSTLFDGGMIGKDGKRVVEPAALSAMLVNSLSKATRTGLVIAEAAAAGESAERALELGGAKGPSADSWRTRMRARPRPQQWRRMFEEVTAIERASRGGHVGAEHFVALCLRWNGSGR